MRGVPNLNAVIARPAGSGRPILATRRKQKKWVARMKRAMTSFGYGMIDR
jgi:hypothetical protein